MNSAKMRNLAIVAHVDHGKTTMVDGLLKQSTTLGDREQIEDRVMDSGELERERGITITAKNCALFYKEYKINLLDTPGHADFGGEVERALSMVDGIILLVDAAEGPLPQTRFVLQKAMEQGLKVGLVINKVDRHDARIEEVKVEVEDLILDLATYLGIDDIDVDLPIFYASGRDGWATPQREFEELTDRSLTPLLDFMISDYYPAPKIKEGTSLQMMVANLSYSPYLGQLFIGRIIRGSMKKLAPYVCLSESKPKNFRASTIQVFDGLHMKEVEEAVAGELVIVSGLNEIRIGDTICSPDNLEALPRLTVEPPTVSVQVSVSTSPLSGQEGEYLTSRKLEEFLIEGCRTNVALQYEPTDDPKMFVLKGRGELQLAIVFEQIRRKGFELMVGRPQVIFKNDEAGNKLEPFEKVVIDVPAEFAGKITETMAIRKGQMTYMGMLGEGRQRIEFEMPSRGLIGYRSQFLTDTKGNGLMSSQFLGFKPYVGDMLARANGAILSDRQGKTTTYALFNLLSSGKQFVKVGQTVYEGMVVGEHTRNNDINVNAVREKHVSAVRTAGKDENMVLPPIPDMSLEFALDWIDNDEWVEITPKTIRIRKKILEQNKRSVRR